MISYAEARATLVRLALDAPGKERETVALAESGGRVLAETVVPSFDIPSFDNSAMDGFALRAADTAAASSVTPLMLSIGGKALAGDAPAVGVGEAWEIATGAPLPTAFDTVVKIEEVTRDGKFLCLRRALAPGENVRRRGSDFAAGNGAILEGTRLGPRTVMALAALGVSWVPVRPRPRVALIATGNELAVPPETPLPPKPGLIYNSSGPYLRAAAEAFGANVTDLGIVTDDPVLFIERLNEAREFRPDVLLTTGAVSVGPHDFVEESLRAAGAEILFHRVAIRPGKPILVARIGPMTIFSLPGNPVSTAVVWRFFVTPYLRAMLRMAPEKAAWVPLSCAVLKPAGLRCFFKASIGADGAEALEGQSSHQIRPLLEASGWMELPEEPRALGHGEKVAFYPTEDLGE